MLNNDVLRSVRYTLNMSDNALLALLRDVAPELDLATLRGYLAGEDDAFFVPMNDELLAGFLDNLIVLRRGPAPGPAPATALPLTNNTVLKKLRVAFNLHEADLIDIFASVESRVARPELSALFRKESSSNYRACGDQLLRQFLKGLALRFRAEAG
ncbi:YehS family protein [Alloalcanivorax mobilis]|uniref:DUF1456 family protein n=1 Tax=Alloalcanivorax mobilis TaxID=2019569 RepID=UPI000C788B29|nr:DUF1456 family protein [Alloalcanivorax mobilis]